MALQNPDELLEYFLGKTVYVSSSNINWLRYDHDAAWLYVGMKHGGIYLYSFVSYEEADDFARSSSQGKWVWANLIRPEREFERVTVPVYWPSGNEPKVEPTI